MAVVRPAAKRHSPGQHPASAPSALRLRRPGGSRGDHHDVRAGGAARAQVPVDDRPAIKAVIAELDPRLQIELYANTQPGIHARSGPLQRVLAGAVAVDPEPADVADGLEAGRLPGMGRFAALLVERGALRPGLSVDDARDWLADALAHALLAPEGGC